MPATDRRITGAQLISALVLTELAVIGAGAYALVLWIAA